MPEDIGKQYNPYMGKTSEKIHNINKDILKYVKLIVNDSVIRDKNTLVKIANRIAMEKYERINRVSDKITGTLRESEINENLRRKKVLTERINTNNKTAANKELEKINDVIYDSIYKQHNDIIKILKNNDAVDANIYFAYNLDLNFYKILIEHIISQILDNKSKFGDELLHSYLSLYIKLYPQFLTDEGICGILSSLYVKNSLNRFKRKMETSDSKPISDIEELKEIYEKYIDKILENNDDLYFQVHSDLADWEIDNFNKSMFHGLLFDDYYDISSIGRNDISIENLAYLFIHECTRMHNALDLVRYEEYVNCNPVYENLYIPIYRNIQLSENGYNSLQAVSGCESTYDEYYQSTYDMKDKMYETNQDVLLTISIKFIYNYVIKYIYNDFGKVETNLENICKFIMYIVDEYKYYKFFKCFRFGFEGLFDAYKEYGEEIDNKLEEYFTGESLDAMKTYLTQHNNEATINDTMVSNLFDFSDKKKVYNELKTIVSCCDYHMDTISNSTFLLCELVKINLLTEAVKSYLMKNKDEEFPMLIRTTISGEPHALAGIFSIDKNNKLRGVVCDPNFIIMGEITETQRLVPNLNNYDIDSKDAKETISSVRHMLGGKDNTILMKVLKVITFILLIIALISIIYVIVIAYQHRSKHNICVHSDTHRGIKM